MSYLRYSALPARHAAINRTIDHVFMEAEPTPVPLRSGEAAAAFLCKLNVSFAQMYHGLSALARRQLNTAMPVSGRHTVPRSLLDQRDQRDFGAVSASPDFSCLKQVVEETVFLNDEQEVTHIGLAKSWARGTLEVYRGPNAEPELYDFSTGNRSMVVLDAIRADVQYRYMYEPNLGRLSFEQHPDMLDVDLPNSGEQFLETFHAMAAILATKQP